jgi:hypothetical protein
MANTTLEDVNDLFMLLNSDYRLMALYSSSVSNFNTYLEGWLLYAINEFSPYCNQVLSYSSGSGVFSIELTQENKLMLAQIMVKYWLQKTVQDILQMNVFVQDHDFRTHASSQNLKAKQDYYNMKREEVSQLLMDYSLKYNPWASWETQVFRS